MIFKKEKEDLCIEEYFLKTTECFLNGIQTRFNACG
jgi:hypothetical protein